MLRKILFKAEHTETAERNSTDIDIDTEGAGGVIGAVAEGRCQELRILCQ